MEGISAVVFVIALYVGFIVLLFLNYSSFARVVVQWSKELVWSERKQKNVVAKLSKGEAAKCYIPFYHVNYIRKVLWGSQGIFGVTGVLSFALMAFNMFVKFVYSFNSAYVMFAGSICMWIGLFLFFVHYGVVTFMVARLYEINTAMAILCLFVPHLACNVIKSAIPSKMSNMYLEEKFNGSKDVVIKRGSN